MAVKILIDPGHYTGVNQSPVVTNYYEGNRMWPLSQYLISALKAYGFEVGCTKSSMGAYPKDSSGQDSVTSRGRMGKGYDFVLSLHSNAASDYSVERAVSIVFVDDDCGEIDDVSYQLGYKIGMAVKNTMGLSSLQMLQKKASGDRDGDGKVNDDYYGFLFGAHQVGVAAVLMEHGFHTHAATANWLLSDSNLKKLAEAEAAVLAEWFGLKKGTTDTTTPQESTQATGFYRVRKTWADAKSQLGAYKNLAGAIKTCPAGYKVFDPSGNVVYEPAAKTEAAASTSTATSTATSLDSARYRDKTKGNGVTYKVTAKNGLNMRTGAGTDKSIIATLDYGTAVTWYGYYSTVSGVKWYLVRTDSGKTGYVSSQYLG